MSLELKDEERNPSGVREMLKILSQKNMIVLSVNDDTVN